MNPQPKLSLPVVPASFTNGATASGNIDTLGFDHASIDILMGAADAVTNKPSVMKVSESDDTVVTNFANVSGAVGGTDFTVPAAVTSGGSGVKLNIDLRGRKRYLKVSVSPVTTQLIAVAANLSKGETAPISATETGVAAVVNI